jgi:hypothetical protein
VRYLLNAGVDPAPGDIAARFPDVGQMYSTLCSSPQILKLMNDAFSAQKIREAAAAASAANKSVLGCTGSTRLGGTTKPAPSKSSFLGQPSQNHPTAAANAPKVSSQSSAAGLSPNFLSPGFGTPTSSVAQRPTSTSSGHNGSRTAWQDAFNAQFNALLYGAGATKTSEGPGVTRSSSTRPRPSVDDEACKPQ